MLHTCTQTLRMSKAKPNSPPFPINFFFLTLHHRAVVTQEICCPLTFMKDRASLGGKTSMSTKVISRPAVPVAKRCAEVKACRLSCGNPAVIYISASSSHQGTKGCLGEAHVTLRSTSSITARFAACQQGGNPASVSHPPSPSSGGSTARSPTSSHMCLSGSKTHGTAPPQQDAQHRPCKGDVRQGESVAALCSSSHDQLEK